MSSNGARAYCPRCGAELRRDQRIGAVCDPCSKAGPGPLPPEFYFPEAVQAALLNYQFGMFIRRVRGYKGWSQRTFAEVVDLSQARVSAIEGGRPLYDIRIIARLHQRLGIPAPLLGFGDPATVVGGATSCDHALGQAQDGFTAVDPGTAAPWASVDEAAVATWQGQAYYELGRVSGDQHWADKAVPLLTQTLALSRPRARALYLPDLAGAHALARDIDTAVTVGHQAVDAITVLSSQRARERLRVLSTVLEPMHASLGVAELRHRLADTPA